MTDGPREIFHCERIRSYLDSYLEGQVPPPEARAMRLHIQRCPDCHARALQRDPLQIFAPLADEERGEAFWEGFWPSVRAGLRQAEVRSSGLLGWLHRPGLAWAAAAVLLVVSLLALTMPWAPTPSPDPSRGAPRVADLPPRAPAGGAADASEDLWPVVLASGVAGEPALPTVEEVRSPTARVLSMKVYGEDQAVMEVVLIVDEEMEL
jgi:anti-sigma factor RsiW